MSTSTIENPARLSRAQRFETGALVDLTELGREAGFTVPVAITAAAHADTIAWTSDHAYQDETGRAWDILWMAHMAALLPQARGAATTSYSVMRIPNDGRTASACLTPLALHIGPGDSGEPVVTISLPNEAP